MKLTHILLSAILCSASICLKADEKRVALVIGNADYKYECGVAPLTTPANDATAIASKLKSLGFTISGNEAQLNMTREQMRQAIIQFRYDSRDADVAIFYYSGHGASRDNKETLLLPIGEKFESVGFRGQCIELEMVIEALQASNSKAKIVFLDACRNSPFNDGTKSVNDINKGLYRIEPPKGLMICYATSAGETASSGSGKYSPYTDAILKQMDVKDIRFGAFLTAVKNRVDIATNHQQVPSTSGYLEGDFYFNNSVNSSDNSPSKKYSAASFLSRAKRGDAKAQNNLGFCYEYGEGVSKDYNQAVYWYRKSAEQGYAVAQYFLGSCYAHGKGVSRDYNQAVYWYRKAAEQGDAAAQNRLGVCYEYGRGVSKDYNQAVYWYRKAAEQGYAVAQYFLGSCYAHGKGVSRDYNQAVYWYRKAAEQGDATAQYNLGWCYEYGRGVSQDYNQAVYWYRKAASQGIEDAKTALNRLNQKP